MMKKNISVVMIFAAILASMNCGERMIQEKAPIEYVQRELDKLAPVALQCDLNQIPNSEIKTLKKLIQAAQIIDQLFLLQVDPENLKLARELERYRGTPDQPYLDLFTVMFGRWNRLDHDKPFLTNKAKPLGAGFYPPDMTKEEFESFLKEHPDQVEAFESNFTVIRRIESKLTAVPYYLAYQPYTEQLAKLLEQAADETNDPTLERFLRLRSQAIRTDDYYDSDMAWMDLNGDLEIVIGPYEVYEDALFNYKAAYEAFLCIVDKAESEKLMQIGGYLNDMEAHLPIADRYKNFNRGAGSPIKVVQEVFAAGDTKAGVQTAAFNLPNDERVREAKGSKKVMLKNVMRAKFEKCWIPIAHAVLAPKLLSLVSFDAYFNEVLMHEMSHSLGPGFITQADGQRVDVSKKLKECYSVIEECKADVLAILNMKFLIDKGVFSREIEPSLYATYLGGMLRSIRFGINEAHGGGVAIQFNYCFERGAFKIDEDGKLDLEEKKLYPTLVDLAHQLLMLQATGDYEGAKKFIEQYRRLTPVLQTAIDRLHAVPVDIRPSYPILNELGLNE